MTLPADQFHDAEGNPLQLQQRPYQGPGDDELSLPDGMSHVWTEGVEPDYGHRS